MPEGKKVGHTCIVCQKPPEETAMVFKTERWCSERHRKVIQGEVYPNHAESASMDQALGVALTKFWADNDRSHLVRLERGER